MAEIAYGGEVAAPASADSLFNLLKAAGYIPAAFGGASATKATATTISLQALTGNGAVIFWGFSAALTLTTNRGGQLAATASILLSFPQGAVDLATLFIIGNGTDKLLVSCWSA